MRAHVARRCLKKWGSPMRRDVKSARSPGGMKQRLGIAQAVINDPAVLVLDEPTAGLDPKERVRFRNLISRLLARQDRHPVDAHRLRRRIHRRRHPHHEGGRLCCCAARPTPWSRASTGRYGSATSTHARPTPWRRALREQRPLRRHGARRGARHSGRSAPIRRAAGAADARGPLPAPVQRPSRSRPRCRTHPESKEVSHARTTQIRG